MNNKHADIVEWWNCFHSIDYLNHISFIKKFLKRWISDIKLIPLGICLEIKISLSVWIIVRNDHNQILSCIWPINITNWTVLNFLSGLFSSFYILARVIDMHNYSEIEHHLFWYYMSYISWSKTWYIHCYECYSLISHISDYCRTVCY